MTRRSALALAVAALLVAACGDDGPPKALQETQDNMAALQQGTLDLQLSAAAGEGGEATGPVGFRLEGPFSFEPGPELAVFDLEYTRLLGDEESSTAVLSTGEEAFVTVEGTTYRVPEEDTADLRLAEDGEEGFGDLGIVGWVEDPEVGDGEPVEGEPTELVTGTVDVADLLSDLARVAGPLMGDGELSPVEGDTADRLQELVRSSSIEVLTTAEDHDLVSLRAVVDFGADVPEELRRSLASYAGARIEVRLSLAPTADVRVEAPEAFETLP